MPLSEEPNFPPIRPPRALKSDTCRSVSISGVFRGVICDRGLRIRTAYESENEWAPQPPRTITTSRYTGSGPFLFCEINDAARTLRGNENGPSDC